MTFSFFARREARRKQQNAQKPKELPVWAPLAHIRAAAKIVPLLAQVIDKQRQIQALRNWARKHGGHDEE